MSPALEGSISVVILLVFFFPPVLPQNETSIIGSPIGLDDALSQALRRLANQGDVTTSTTHHPGHTRSQSSDNNTLVVFNLTNSSQSTVSTNATGSGSLEDEISTPNNHTRNVNSDGLGKTTSQATAAENGVASFPQTTEFTPSGAIDSNQEEEHGNSANITDGVTSLPSESTPASSIVYPNFRELYLDSALAPPTQAEIITSRDFPISRSAPTQESTSKSRVITTPERPIVLINQNPNLNLTGFDAILQLLRKSFTSQETTNIPPITSTTTKPILVRTDLQSILKGLLYQNETKLSSHQSALSTTTLVPETSPVIDPETVTNRGGYVKDIVNGILKALQSNASTTPSLTSAYVTSQSLTPTAPTSAFASGAPITKKESYVKDIVDGIVKELNKNASTTPLARRSQTSAFVESTSLSQVSTSSRPTTHGGRSPFTVTNQPTNKPALSENQLQSILGNFFRPSPLSTTLSIFSTTTTITTRDKSTTTETEAVIQENVISNILDKLVNVPQSTMIMTSAMLNFEETSITPTTEATSDNRSPSDFPIARERTEKSVSGGTTLIPFSVVSISLLILTPAISEIGSS